MVKEVKRYKTNVRDATSRYRDNDRIEYSDGIKMIETSDRIVFPHKNTDQYFTVDASVENRLDLISWKFYDSALYWWAIAAASNIYDPFDIPVGTTLRIPALADILGRNSR